MLWRYQIGFPMKIASVTMYLSGERFQSGKAIGTIVGAVVLIFVMLAGLGYGLWARAKERLQAETERLRNEWIANITHDIKAPLSPIFGYAELLTDEEHGLDANTVRRYGEAIGQSAEHAQVLIDDLKLTYQIESGSIPMRKERIDVTRLMKDLVIEMMNHPKHAGREMAFTGDDSAFADVDASLVRRAVGNVILNALGHNPPKTTVEVSVGRERDAVVIHVQDDGKGLSREEQTRLFDRYYRSADTRLEGSGLGMSIVKQIVELHGGAVSVDSAPGRGMRVTIRLPMPRN